MNNDCSSINILENSVTLVFKNRMQLSSLIVRLFLRLFKEIITEGIPLRIRCNRIWLMGDKK
ncbi:MAG: hypothetical protein V1663_02585 [archaeon]